MNGCTYRKTFSLSLVAAASFIFTCLQHLALKQTGKDAKVVAAFDINSIANTCYEHNFPDVKVTRVNIEHLGIDFYERLGADAWLMSPPCQPFTRGGKCLDDKDHRSTGFLYLTDVLRNMKHPPRFLFIENVLNFEVSKCHEAFIRMAQERGYQVHEFLISPQDEHIGIPNTRLRYYLIAELTGTTMAVGPIYKSFAEFFSAVPERKPQSSTDLEQFAEPRLIGEFIREADDDASLAVPLRYLTDWKDYRHDITKASSRRSSTFTKAYGSKHIIGTGSFLQTKLLDLQYEPDDRAVLPKLGLRFFSPREVALLHAFPIEGADALFSFPPSVSKAQQYKLLGNSMNISVVTLLFRIMFYREQ